MIFGLDFLLAFGIARILQFTNICNKSNYWLYRCNSCWWSFSSFSIHAFFDHALDRIKWWGKRIMRLFCFFCLKNRFLYKCYFKLYAFTITHLICVESCLLRYLFNVSLLILILAFLIKIGICIIKFILYRKLLEIYIFSHFYTSKNLQYGRAVKWAFFTHK